MVAPELIDSVSCLSGLSLETRAALAEGFDEVEVPAGQAVANQGDFAYELFAILDGTAQIVQDGEVVATLGPSDMCGEIGLLLTGRRTASIVAETPLRVLAMFEQRFRRLSREYPEFGDVVHGQSSGRFTRPATA